MVQKHTISSVGHRLHTVVRISGIDAHTGDTVSMFLQERADKGVITAKALFHLIQAPNPSKGQFQRIVATVKGEVIPIFL